METINSATSSVLFAAHQHAGMRVSACRRAPDEPLRVLPLVLWASPMPVRQRAAVRPWTVQPCALNLTRSRERVPVDKRMSRTNSIETYVGLRA